MDGREVKSNRGSFEISTGRHEDKLILEDKKLTGGNGYRKHFGQRTGK
jgi:hypothetical protein